MAFFKIKTTGKKSKICFCGIPFCTVKHGNSEIERIIDEKFNMLFYTVLPALKKHENIFAKYKNSLKGKDVVLFATGPTCNFFHAMPDKTYVGVNSAYLKQNVKLDYLFVEDRYPTIANGIADIKKYPCKKFYGIHYMQPTDEPFSSISQDDLSDDAEQFYFLNYDPEELGFFARMNADITARPLTTYGSVAFTAMDFILWTHPKRIWLVGCDCAATGHFDAATDKFKRAAYNTNAVATLKKGWLFYQEFAGRHYPETEIVSVNPVGLKGVFRDVYTESYLNEHPEIDRAAVEVLREDE